MSGDLQRARQKEPEALRKVPVLVTPTVPTQSISLSQHATRSNSSFPQQAREQQGRSSRLCLHLGLFCQERNRNTVVEMPATLQKFQLLLCPTAQAAFSSSLSCILDIYSFELHALIPIPWLKMIAQPSFHQGPLPCGSSLLKQPRNSCWAQQETLPALEFVLHHQGNGSFGTPPKGQVMQPRPLRGRI